MNPALQAAIEAQMGKLGFALHKLLTCTKIWGNIKLKPEERLSIDLANELRRLSKQYQETGKGLRAVWSHVANERQASAATFQILRAMGMIAGAPDFWFIWEGGGGMIELKVAGNSLQEMQEHFCTWSNFLKVKRATQRNVPDAIERLKDWGAIVE